MFENMKRVLRDCHGKKSISGDAIIDVCRFCGKSDWDGITAIKHKKDCVVGNALAEVAEAEKQSKKAEPAKSKKQIMDERFLWRLIRSHLRCNTIDEGEYADKDAWYNGTKRDFISRLKKAKAFVDKQLANLEESEGTK